MMVLALAAVPGLLLGPVELRGGGLVDAPIEGVSLLGVEVGGEEARVIGWDNVKLVIGDGAEQASAYMDMGERAWRARVRLSRGDYGMASGLMEGLFVRLRDEEGPTALMVAEGTLACRLWFGDRVGAVEAWLAAVRLRAAGWKIAGDPPLDPIVDPQTLLMPGLAPVWFESDDLLRLVEFCEVGAIEDEDVAGSLRVLYGASVRRVLGMEVDEAAVSAAASGGRSHPGVMLVGQVVQSMAEDPGVRAAARDALSDGLDEDLGTWREAWRRAAVGLSLLSEEDAGMRLDGLFELIHLPARFSRSQSYLSGLALAVMSVEVGRSGDAASAARLRGELHARHPGHPGLRWLDDRARELRNGVDRGGDRVEPDQQESELIDADD